MAMEFLRGLDKVFAASGLFFPACRCGTERVATEICLSTDDEDCDDFSRGLREVSMEYSWPELSRATLAFSCNRVLGKGRTGTVYDGRLEEGMDVAVKVVDEAFFSTLHDEVRLLSRCHHPNVVMLLGFSHEAYQGRQAIVYELLPGGSIHSKLHVVPDPNFTWERRLRAGLQLVRALAHLHRMRPEVFHGNVRSAAVLFSSEGVAKLTDFHFARSSRRSHHFTSGAASPRRAGYTAPEVECGGGGGTEACEVFAAGVVLMELLTGRLPAAYGPDGVTCTQLVRDLVRPEEAGCMERLIGVTDEKAGWPKETAAGLAALSLQCLAAGSERRPPFADLVSLFQHVALVATQSLGKAVSRTSSTVSLATDCHGLPLEAAEPVAVAQATILPPPAKPRPEEVAAVASAAVPPAAVSPEPVEAVQEAAPAPEPAATAAPASTPAPDAATAAPATPLPAAGAALATVAPVAALPLSAAKERTARLEEAATKEPDSPEVAADEAELPLSDKEMQSPRPELLLTGEAVPKAGLGSPEGEDAATGRRWLQKLRQGSAEEVGSVEERGKWMRWQWGRNEEGRVASSTEATPAPGARWLQAWMRTPSEAPPTGGNGSAWRASDDGVNSGEEAGSEDERQQRRWWRKWPQTPAVAASVSRREESGESSCYSSPAQDKEEQLEDLAGASPDRSAIGRLHNISDFVE